MEKNQGNKIIYDENGIYILSNGIKVIAKDMWKCSDENCKSILKCMGYDISCFYVRSKNVKWDNYQLFYNLFSRKIEFLVSHNGREYPEDYLLEIINRSNIIPRDKEMGEILSRGVKKRAISQEFVEKSLNTKIKDNKIIANGYELYFQNGLLIDFDLEPEFNIYARYFFRTTLPYFEKRAMEYFQNNKKKVCRLINLMATSLAELPQHIANKYNNQDSEFLYDKGYVNWIAVYVFYEIGNISLSDFIDSTFGEYKLISNTLFDGVRTIEIEAYSHKFSFRNGNSSLFS